MKRLDRRAHRPTGKKRGPKAGQGAHVRWTLEALQTGPKCVDEMMMGCTYRRSGIQQVVSELGKQGMIEPDPDNPKRKGEFGRWQTVFRINPNKEKEIADLLAKYQVTFVAAQARVNSIRELDNAWHGIIAGRVASA